jgi:GeoRSP system radical SAM/SPASM protein
MRKDSDLLSAPLTVNWSLSYRCNFTCRHCYSRTWTEEPLALENVLKVVDLLQNKGVVFVNFGGGEPLLDSRIYDVAAASASAGLKVTMNSNGYLLDGNEAVRIAEAGFHSVGISIDSPDEKVHDRFRNMEGSFDKAVQALDHLQDAGVRTTVSCVINRNNVENWERMVDICRDHGAGTLYLHNYKCSGMGKVNMADLDLEPLRWERFYRDALEVQSRVSDVTLSFDDPIMASLPDYNPETAVPGSTCGKLSLHLAPNGDITPCGFIQTVIGNILHDDFDRIWFHSPILEAMRSKSPKGKCDGCSSYEACLGGCTARVYAITGTFDQPDPHCWIEEEEEAHD